MDPDAIHVTMIVDMTADMTEAMIAMMTGITTDHTGDILPLRAAVFLLFNIGKKCNLGF